MTARDDARARVDLYAALGQPGSGRVRYAAAMYFNCKGLLSSEALEVYRICSARDGDDPAALMATRGLAPNLPPPPDLNREQALRLLLDEVDRYLATLPGAGIAESRAGLAALRDGPVRPEPRGPDATVRAYLPAALAALTDSHPALATAIEMAEPHLCWRVYDSYPPEQIGTAFNAGHAYTSLIGEGAIAADDFDLGLFLIAPGLLYRDHAHPAPELYAPLTGPHGWRFAPEGPITVKPAHEPVWNEPGQPHLTKVGPVPFLCIYCWTRDVNEPAQIIAATDWDALERQKISA
ncbi:dimethylsulfonioproprionate lyase family protein [Defluviimonas aestuarii]|uniref:dimethylsulfonioproprionate lyase family protein n=1 Tax=Albidovulum aestuarii TaxID=1130726 RepID=UPI00249CC93E|nr:dimethylsulfonioproprionate lyase family protein [Defluviimonas aestuarii]MDI3336746.1 dimethylsulfonioproprionate lyase family protein [Defluviimonas aestuarii]